MIIVVKNACEQKQFDNLVEWIKDLGLENVTITFENTSSSKVNHVGGIIGVLYGKIKGCFAKNVTITNTSETLSVD